MRALAVVLLCVASSLVAVGIRDALREARPAPEAQAPRSSLAVDSAPAPEPDLPERAPAPDLSGLRLRMEALERRVVALEEARDDPREAVASEAAAAEDLRDLVLTWIEEERANRTREDEALAALDAEQQLEFEVRTSAHAMAREFGLVDWQEEELAKAWIEVERRRRELQASIDPTTDDPKEVEDRWIEFNTWAEDHMRAAAERISPELAEELYGDD